MKLTRTMLVEASIGCVVFAVICLLLAWGSQGPTENDINTHEDKMIAPISPAHQDEKLAPAVKKQTNLLDLKQSNFKQKNMPLRKIFKKKRSRGSILRRIF